MYKTDTFKKKKEGLGTYSNLELFPCVVLNGFLYRGLCLCYYSHTQADQLLPQLLMEQFDILPIQYRHIEHMHEGEGSKKIF